MEKKRIDDKMRLALRLSFPKEAYSQHPTKKFLTTLKAMYVTERLNDVFGIGRWSIEHEVVERTSDYILVKGKFISLDYEVEISEQYGGHTTVGKNTEIADGYKSAITDCQSKIASLLEVGIDMFKGKVKVLGNTTNYKDNTKKYEHNTKKAISISKDDYEEAMSNLETQEKPDYDVWKKYLGKFVQDARIKKLQTVLELKKI